MQPGIGIVNIQRVDLRNCAGPPLFICRKEKHRGAVLLLLFFDLFRLFVIILREKGIDIHQIDRIGEALFK